MRVEVALTHRMNLGGNGPSSPLVPLGGAQEPRLSSIHPALAATGAYSRLNTLGDLRYQVIAAIEANRQGGALKPVYEHLGGQFPLFTYSGSLGRKLTFAPLHGDRYSPLDRALIVVDGSPGQVFSHRNMVSDRFDRFRANAEQMAYAMTHLTTNGQSRAEVRVVEYHIVANDIDPTTIQYFYDHIPYVKVVVYRDLESVVQASGKVVLDLPRQYRFCDLSREGSIRESSQNRDSIEVVREGVVVRRFPKKCLTKTFYHYLERLSPAQQSTIYDWLSANHKKLSEMSLNEGKALIEYLLSKKGWRSSDIHALIGAEGMKEIYGHGEEMPFGFISREHWQTFHHKMLSELKEVGFTFESGEMSFYLTGSSVSGYSSSGGPFRWQATSPDRSASDVDIVAILSEKAIATLKLSRVNKHSTAHHDTLPHQVQVALRRLGASLKRKVSLMLCLRGGDAHQRMKALSAPMVHLSGSNVF